ncbi:butyrophilin-like protein 3 isoform X2 [Castor canadensis]|uniref:Butyrophilin-like protein 3 isoform X2 n=1 Tax=Castor canadensis TaxID=51338 RepID=A0AC58L8X4_CASCN
MKSFHCNTFMPLVLMLVVSLLKPCLGQWQVVGPEKPIRVFAGEDAVFPCFLSPEANAHVMEVRFFKEHFSDIVHLYQDGKDQKYMQMPAYQGRTELVKDFIMDGHVFLRLKKVSPSDAGLYGCWFSSQTHEQEAIWELQVTEMGSTPLISIVGYIGGGIQLLCQSSGWLSQPIVKWKGPEGFVIPAQFKVNKDIHGRFDVETSLTVQENSGIISCSMQLTDQSPEVKSRLLIGETFFQTSPWLPPSIVLMLLCIGGCAWIIRMSILPFKLMRELENELELEKMHRCTVELTLDPDTAHPKLYISDLKTVIWRNAPQEVDISEKRFMRMCVVTSQGFQKGRHYWEVDVGHNKRWYLGVCFDDVDRKQYVTLSPINGYWVLGQETDNWCFVFIPDRVHLFVRTNPTQVGIFLDYEAGILSFFNLDDKSLIYTLTHQFRGLLRPYIQHCPYNEENVSSIFIGPVSQRKKPFLKKPLHPPT